MSITSPVHFEVELDPAPSVARFRERCWITFPSIEQDSVLVQVRVELNDRHEKEAEALRLFGGGRTALDLKYRVEINLASHRERMLRLIDRLYAFTEDEAQRETALAMRKDVLLPIGDAAVRNAFMPIEVEGRNLFRRLFYHVDSFEQRNPSDTQLLREVLRSVFARENAIVVETTRSELPWAFLYDDVELDPDNATTLDPARFWGFRHQLQEEVEGVEGAHVNLSYPPHLAAALCPRVDPLGEHIQQVFTPCPGRDFELRLVEDREDLLSLLAAPFEHDCFYFCGHAHHDDPPLPTTSAILFDQLRVTVDDIDNRGGPLFQKNPVVAFLNGCETSQLGTWSKDTVVGFLCRKSPARLCAITTTGRVPAAFARAIGIQFWRRFLAHASVGEALHGARLSLYEKYRNPLGLVYSILGRAETRLSR